MNLCDGQSQYYYFFLSIKPKWIFISTKYVEQLIVKIINLQKLRHAWDELGNSDFKEKDGAEDGLPTLGEVKDQSESKQMISLEYIVASRSRCRRNIAELCGENPPGSNWPHVQVVV